jgi:DNA-3-methyladenine glycosylase II
MVNYNTKEMEYISNKNPVMKALVNHYGKLEKGRTQDIYVSLVLHIISQQLSNTVSYALIRKYINHIGEINPENVLVAGADAICDCGISRKKADYIIALSKGVIEKKYDFSLLEDMSDAEATNYLTQIKGVGKWTAEMILEFTMGRLNVFCFDDVALQNGIKKAHGFKTLSKLRFERLRRSYSPYCSVASLYYYSYNDDKSGWKVLSPCLAKGNREKYVTQTRSNDNEHR